MTDTSELRQNCFPQSGCSSWAEATTELIEDEDFRKLFEIHSVGPSQIGPFRIAFILIDAQTEEAKVDTYLAVATFFVATLGAGVAGYIQWAHLQAEK